MRIYFGHSKSFDYINEYYIPIKENKRLQKETLIFPHEDNANNKHEINFYTKLDLFIAEVSYRATGLGIELSFASDDNIPIYCFYKKGIKPNSSLKSVLTVIVDILKILSKIIYNNIGLEIYYKLIIGTL